MIARKTSKEKAVKNKKISRKKVETVSELSELIKNKKTILIASIKNLPASQFQEISKKLRSKAIIKVPKKNLIFKAIDNSEIKERENLKKQIKNSIAILFSDIDSFELASQLTENKISAKAKAGQESPEDILIEPGPTDLIPGPAISELGALGIQIQIEKGKIMIKEPKVIVKKGGKISSGAADIMSKLDIKPFSVGFIPLSAFDTHENKIYLSINVDKEKTIKELKEAFIKAQGFAVEICYISKDTIKFLIRKAAMHEKALEKFDREYIGKKLDSIESKNKSIENLDNNLPRSNGPVSEQNVQEIKSNSEGK